MKESCLWLGVGLGTGIGSGLWFVCWLLAYRPSNVLVYLRDGSAQAIVRAATPRQKSQIKLSISPSQYSTNQSQS